MKAIIILSLFVAATFAATCTPLEIVDTACEGHRANFPAKACSPLATMNATTAACDMAALYSAWAGLCPLKNAGNASFCEGTGYSTGYTTFPIPCLSITACETDDDCNPTVEPVAPQAPPPLLCYECCTFCFEDAECKTKVRNNQTYTDSTTCTPCRETPVAAPTAGNTPGTSTPGARSPNAAAAVVVSGTILAFAAALLF